GIEPSKRGGFPALPILKTGRNSAKNPPTVTGDSSPRERKRERTPTTRLMPPPRSDSWAAARCSETLSSQCAQSQQQRGLHGTRRQSRTRKPQTDLTTRTGEFTSPIAYAAGLRRLGIWRRLGASRRMRGETGTHLRAHGNGHSFVTAFACY